jgi:hypothetical protein
MTAIALTQRRILSLPMVRLQSSVNATYFASNTTMAYPRAAGTEVQA